MPLRAYLLQQSWIISHNSSIMLQIIVKQFSMRREPIFSFLFFLRADLDVGTSAVAAFINVILTSLYINWSLSDPSDAGLLIEIWTLLRLSRISHCSCVHFELNPRSAVTLIFGQLMMLWFVGGFGFLRCGQWGSERTDFFFFFLSTTECAALMP